MTRKRTYTGLVGTLRDKLEAVIAEYREWASVYLIGDEAEVIGGVFNILIENGDIRFARRNIRHWGRQTFVSDSTGIFGMALAHAEYIGASWKKLHRAEKRALTNPRLVKVG